MLANENRPIKINKPAEDPSPSVPTIQLTTTSRERSISSPNVNLEIDPVQVSHLCTILMVNLALINDLK